MRVYFTFYGTPWGSHELYAVAPNDADIYGRREAVIKSVKRRFGSVLTFHEDTSCYSFTTFQAAIATGPNNGSGTPFANAYISIYSTKAS